MSDRSKTHYLRPVTPERRREIDSFISRLSLMKEEAVRLGLYRTHQALRQPVHTVGYELADLLSGKQNEIPEMQP
jgi:hypothetical protein